MQFGCQDRLAGRYAGRPLFVGARTEFDRVHRSVGPVNSDSWNQFSELLRLFFWCHFLVEMLVIVKPDTVVRWHRQGFRLFWRWMSQRGKKTGRPPTKAELRKLIRKMASENKYQKDRTHLALGKDTPAGRPVMSSWNTGFFQPADRNPAPIDARWSPCWGETSGEPRLERPLTRRRNIEEGQLLALGRGFEGKHRLWYCGSERTGEKGPSSCPVI